MAQAMQTVIYRFDAAHDPAWQFHSMPESIVGGGATLDDARSEYIAALAFSTDSDALPVIREYAEAEVDGLGIWLRLPVDHPNAEAVREQVVRHLVAHHPADRDWFFANTTAGGDPVIITATADAPLSSILEQMTPSDTIILAMLGQPEAAVQVTFVSVNRTSVLAAS